VLIITQENYFMLQENIKNRKFLFGYSNFLYFFIFSIILLTSCRLNPAAYFDEETIKKETHTFLAEKFGNIPGFENFTHELYEKIRKYNDAHYAEGRRFKVSKPYNIAPLERDESLIITESHLIKDIFFRPKNDIAFEPISELVEDEFIKFCKERNYELKKYKRALTSRLIKIRTSYFTSGSTIVYPIIGVGPTYVVSSEGAPLLILSVFTDMFHDYSNDQHYVFISTAGTRRLLDRIENSFMDDNLYTYK
jgi:hypothetical protein